MIPRLKELYKNEIKNSIKEKYGFKNLNMSAFVGTKIKSRRALLELLDECIENDMRMAV